MAFFLAQATYATEGYRGMISDPHDRGPAMEALAEASGVKIIFMGYAVATGQITGIFEGTLKNVGGMEFAVLASGAMADFKVTELISLADMADLMQAGSEISNRYTPPNRDKIDRMLLDEWPPSTPRARYLEIDCQCLESTTAYYDYELKIDF